MWSISSPAPRPGSIDPLAVRIHWLGKGTSHLFLHLLKPGRPESCFGRCGGEGGRDLHSSGLVLPRPPAHPSPSWPIMPLLEALVSLLGAGTAGNKASHPDPNRPASTNSRPTVSSANCSQDDSTVQPSHSLGNGTNRSCFEPRAFGWFLMQQFCDKGV